MYVGLGICTESPLYSNGYLVATRGEATEGRSVGSRDITSRTYLNPWRMDALAIVDFVR